jgi:hypothetical protein
MPYRAILSVVAVSLKERLQLLADLVLKCALIAVWFLPLMAAAVAAASMHFLDSCLGAGVLITDRAEVGMVTGLSDRCCRALVTFARFAFPAFIEVLNMPGACRIMYRLPKFQKCDSPGADLQIFVNRFLFCLE